MDLGRETDRIVTELSVRHPLFARRTVERLVRREFDGFRDSAVTTYLPVLVLRRADAALRELDFDFDVDHRQAAAGGSVATA